MISLDFLTSAAGGTSHAYGGQSESHSNGWLLELERAWLDSEKARKGASQPGEHLRVDAPKVDANDASAEGKSGEAVPVAASLDTPGLSSVQETFSGVSASHLQFDPSISAIFASLGQSLEAPPPADQPFVDGQASGTSAGMASAGAARPGASEKSLLSQAGEESASAESDVGANMPNVSTADEISYPEKRLHLLEDEHSVRVWIRDASLSEARGQSVASVLRGELGAAGLRLVSVALNGKKITSYGDSSREPEAASLKQDAGHMQSMIDESNLYIAKLSQKEHS